MTERFTGAGQTETEAVKIAPAAKTLQVVVTWSSRSDRFDLTNFQYVETGAKPPVPRMLESTLKKPAKLRISRKRTATSVETRIAKPGRRPGRLRFHVVSKKVGRPAQVKVTVRQSRR